MKRYAFTLHCAAFATTAGALGVPPARASSATIGQILSGDPRFSHFVHWAKLSGAGNRLSTAGPYTVFAPTNDAFGGLVPGLAQTMTKPSNQGRLLSVILYHVIAGAIPYTAFRSGTVRTQNGQLLTVSNINGIVRVNNYGISSHAIAASNGLIYPCSAVLVPPMTERM
jgi:uncharacterized surface protein with fasciclin (FAS1) repeats